MTVMQKKGRQPVLTANGKGEEVLLDTTYPEVAGHPGAVTSIRRGLAQARMGVGRAADEVFDELDGLGVDAERAKVSRELRTRLNR